MTYRTLDIEKTSEWSIQCTRCDAIAKVTKDSPEYLEWKQNVKTKTAQNISKFFGYKGWRVDPDHFHKQYCPECAKAQGFRQGRRRK